MIPDGTRIDPVADATLDSLKHMMTAWMTQDVWDQAPGLLLLVRIDRPGVGVLQGPVPFGLSDEIWLDRPVWQVLTAIAHAVRAVGTPDTLPDGADVAGVALLTEAWILRTRAGSRDAAAAHAYAEHHSIADHPDGVETKMIMAVDTAGFVYLVEQGRGEPDSTGVVDTRLGDRAGRLDGRLVDALSAILDAAVAR